VLGGAFQAPAFSRMGARPVCADSEGPIRKRTLLVALRAAGQGRCGRGRTADESSRERNQDDDGS
jgi:hypothetical protein